MQTRPVDERDVSVISERSGIFRKAARLHHEATSGPFGGHHAIKLTHHRDADFERLPLFALDEEFFWLTFGGQFQARISDPRFNLLQTDWGQVEGEPDNAALHALRGGVQLKNFPTRPASVGLMDAPPCL